MDKQGIAFYKSAFTGVYTVRETGQLPFHRFSEMEWHQISFTELEEIEPYDGWELNTSNAWYARVLISNKGGIFKFWSIHACAPVTFNRFPAPWYEKLQFRWPLRLKMRPHLVVQLDDAHVLDAELREVVLKRIEPLDVREPWEGNLRRARGIAYFQVHHGVKTNPPEQVPEEVAKPTGEVQAGDAPSLGLESTVVVTDLSKVIDEIRSTDVPLAPATENTAPPRKRRWWRVLFALWCLFCLWKAPILLVLTLVLWLVVKVFKLFGRVFLRFALWFIALGVLGLFLFGALSDHVEQENPLETEDGTVKVLPPKSNGDKDLISTKEVIWSDFQSNRFKLAYGTSATDFFDSETAHSEIFNQIQAQNTVDFYQQLYAELHAHDEMKLDSVVQKLQELARGKQLNAFQTAEMVCTFVQEVPYFLVHDYDCPRAVAESGSYFVAEYHSENKPCLPEVPGGVQSPYEFIHNLKGDCDTRSLLAFSILKKMKIPASVWISETYGHSVLGVGIPSASGFSKEIQGIEHYAVELTTKGFRLGMIAPEHQVSWNWEIALFYHP